jgi:aspartate aminotransferase-like enzyme
LDQERRLIMLPGPTNVPDRIMRAMIRPMINHRGPEFAALLSSISEGLKYVFETREEVFVLTSSGTGAVECAISNTINAGDKVIVPSFGYFSERLQETVARHGGKVIDIPVEWGQAPTVDQIEEALKKEKEVKLIAIVDNETSTGVTVRDLPKIAEIAKQNDALLMADSISILGGDYLPFDKWGIDLCVTGIQKCLACPPGLALIAVSKRAWQVIGKKTAKPPYYFDLPSIREHWLRKETPTTPALSLYYALEESLKMVREEGLEERYRRYATCARAFYEGFEAMGLTPYAAKNSRSNTVVTVKLPSGVDVGQVKEVMKERYNIVISGGLGKIRQLILRIGCMGTISQAEVFTTINALENTLADLNCPVKIGAGTEAARKVFGSQ